MRIDKYLKNARLIKRRTLAKEACDSGRVSVNGKAAKAGSEVKVGDEITLRMGANPLTVKVLSLSEHVRKEDAETLFEVISS